MRRVVNGLHEQAQAIAAGASGDAGGQRARLATAFDCEHRPP
jgi:hypothetical protein